MTDFLGQILRQANDKIDELAVERDNYKRNFHLVWNALNNLVIAVSEQDVVHGMEEEWEYAKEQLEETRYVQ